MSMSMGEYTFFMKVEDVFEITDRGTIVVGKIQKGELRLPSSAGHAGEADCDRLYKAPT